MSSQVEYVESPFFSAFDESVVKDESMNSFEYIRITPDTPVNNPQLILRNQDKSNWYLPCESFLEINLTLKNGPNAGTPIAAGDNLALINNALHLFTDARLRANQQEIEFKRLVGEGSTILNAINYSEDYASSVASNGYWYQDVGTRSANGVNLRSADATDLQPIEANVDNNNYNRGQVQRVRLCRTNGSNSTYTVMIKLSEAFGFLRDVRIPFVGIQWELELNRQTSMTKLFFGSTDLNTNGGVENIKFNKVELWMPRVKPSIETERRILGKFESGQTHGIAWREFKVHESGPTASESFQFDIPSMTNKPNNVYIAFKRQKQLTSARYNYGVYHHCNVTDLYLEINGKRYPEQPIQCNFLTNDYTRAYMQMLAASSKCDSQNCDVGSIINYENFKNNYALFCVDVSKLDPSVYENVNVTQIRLFVRFGSSAAADGALLENLQDQIPAVVDVNAPTAAELATATANENRIAYAVVEADRMATVSGANGQLSITF